MQSQSFANPSIGLVVGRALANPLAVVARIGQLAWNGLGHLGQARARGELQRMANSYATSQPELSAQLRACFAKAGVNSALRKHVNRRERGCAGNGIAAARGRGPNVVRPG